MKRIIVALGLLVLPSLASAYGTQNVVIDKFNVWAYTPGAGIEDNVIRITVPGGTQVQNPRPCSDGDSYMVDYSLPAEAQSRIYSTLLSASVAGKSVTVVLNIEKCVNNRAAVVSAFVNAY